jgi:outer membrane protein assembly factor BamB
MDVKQTQRSGPGRGAGGRGSSRLAGPGARIALALALLGASWLLPATALADGPDGGSPWPQLKRDGPKAGIGAASAPVKPGVAWSFNAGSAIVSGPIVANDGTVYIGTENFRVRAVNQGGTQRWEYTLPDSGGGQPPTYLFVNQRSRITFGTQNGYIIGLQTDGKEDWKFDTRNAPFGNADPQAVRAAPAGGANYGRVLFGTDRGLVYEMQDGAFAGIRRSEADGAVRAGAAVSPNGTIIWAAGRALRAGSATGPDLWRHVLDGTISATPAIGGDNSVYVPTENGSVYSYSTEGQLRWQARPGDGRRYRAGPAIGTDGTIYVAGDEGRLFALDPANGSTKWSFGTGGAVNASPAVGANGLVYLASGDGKVYVLSQSGRELGQFQTDGSIDGSSPAIGADGTLYVGTRTGTLYALRGDFTVPSDGGAPAPAPTPSAPVVTVPAPPGFAFVRCPSGRVYVLNSDGRLGTYVTSPAQIGGQPIFQASENVPTAFLEAICGSGR